MGRLLYLGRVWAGSNLGPAFAPPKACPVQVTFNLTENCQAKCVSCDYWKARWQDHISTDVAVRTIDELGKLGVEYLRFTGGEPLLRKDLFTILSRVDATRYRRISIQTNGLLLKKLHTQINDSPITKVGISLDGLRQKNDVIRGIKGYFDLAIEGAELLRGKEIQIATTLTGMAADDLEELVRIANQRRWQLACNLLDNRLYFFRDGQISGLWPDADAVETIVAVLRSHMNRPAYELEYIKSYYSRTGATDGMDEPPCALGYLEMMITSSGDVRTGCYVLPPLGNILTESITDILSSQKYSARCREMLKRECPGCTCGVFTNLRITHSLTWLSHRLGQALSARSHV